MLYLLFIIRLALALSRAFSARFGKLHLFPGINRCYENELIYKPRTYGVA